MADEPVRLWRCRECGKWSHAKRRPRHHERFIEDGSDPEHEDWSAEEIAGWLELQTIRLQAARWNGDPDHDGTPGGAWVACGPFDAWEATRVDRGEELHFDPDTRLEEWRNRARAAAGLPPLPPRSRYADAWEASAPGAATDPPSDDIPF